MGRLSMLAVSAAVAALLAPLSADGAPRREIHERLLLIHAVPGSKIPESERAALQSAYDGIVEHLTDKGYRVVDKASAEQCSLQIAATHEIDPALNKAASFGLKFFAEYTIFIKTSTIMKDSDTGKGALVKVTAKVIDTTSSQVITSKTADASSAGLSLADATEKAARTAGKKLATSLDSAMARYYQENSGRGRIYTVVIDNPASDQPLYSLLAQLEQITSVTAAREVESGGGKSTFEICYKGKRDELDRDLLKAAGQLGWRLDKIRSEGNRSTWKSK